MGSKLGSVFVELSLDDKIYKQKLGETLTSAQATTKGIETSWRALGVKSDAVFEAQRRSAENAYTLIKNAHQSSANDILRAEKAKNEQLARLNEQQFGQQSSLLDNLKQGFASVLPGVGALTLGIGGIGVALGAMSTAATAALAAFKNLAFQVRDLTFLSGGTAEQVSGLIDVLDDYGVEMDTVDRAMVKLSKAVHEGSPSLDQLGISIRTATGHLKSAHTLFYEIVDALKNTRSEVERNALAQDIFGKGWINMLPVLQQGSAVLKEMAAASELIMTKEDIARADEYRKQLAELDDAWLKMKIEFTRGVIVPITFFLKGEPLFSGTKPRESQNWLETIFGRELAAMISSNTGWGKTESPVPFFPEGMPALPPPEGETEGEKKAREIREKAEQEKNLRMARLLEEDLARREKIAGEWYAYVSQMDAESIKKEEQKLARNQKLQEEGLADFRKEQMEAAAIYTKYLDDREKKEIESEARILKQQAEGKEEFAKIMKEVGELTSKSQMETYQRAVEAADKQRDAYRQVFDSISSGITTAIRGVQQGTQTMAQAFRNMALNIMLSIQDLVIRRGIDAIADALLGAKGTTSTGLLGGALSAIGSGIAGYFGGGAAAAPTTTSGPTFLAEGAVVTRPTISLIGDAGPEAVIPLSRVGGMGGSPVIVNLNVSPGVPEAVRREVSAMMPMIEQRTTAAVIAARNRGGAMALAMGARG